MLLLNPLPQRLDSGATPTFAGLLAGDGTAAAPSIAFANSTNMGFFRYGTNDLGVSVLGATSFIIGSGGTLYGANGTARLTLPASGSVGLVAAGTAQNITLAPSTTGYVDIVGSNDASFANALRVLTPTLSNNNSALILLGKASAANQSAFINYFYTTTASNTRLDFGHNGTTGQVSLMQTGRFLIGTGGVDSGALLQIGNDSSVISGGMVFGTSTFFYRRGDGILGIGHATIPQLYFTDPSGNVFGFVLGSTNLLRLGGNGASGQTRIDSGGAQACIFDTSQNATFANQVRGTGNVSSDTALLITSKLAFTSAANGVAMISNAGGTDFTRLQFGGTTASFPALKRSGPSFHARLADDTAYTDMAVSVLYAFGGQIYFDATGTVVLRAGANSPEGAITAPVGSLYSRTNGGAGTTLYVKESGTGNTGWVAK